MGRIRTHFVKGIAKKLIHAYPEKFSADYEGNKKALVELKIIDEKFTRNKVAGYIVRILRARRHL